MNYSNIIDNMDNMIDFINKNGFLIIILLQIINIFIVLNICLDNTKPNPILGGNNNNEIYVFKFFYADWCPHCRNFKSIWNDLKENYKSDKIKFEDVDCVANENIAEQSNIEGFPTLRLYSTDNKYDEYNGSRSLENIKEYLDKKIN